ncbi:MAG: heparinase [Gemmatimonadetes bacterium]|nr:heparinase [Gemmatimonadota bacterium]
MVLPSPIEWERTAPPKLGERGWSQVRAKTHTRSLTMIKTLLILLFLTVPLHAEDQRNILTGRVTQELLQDLITPLEDFRPFPKASNRATWQNLPEPLRKRYIRNGERSLDFEWPNLPASVYLEFDRVGNRSNYESIAGRRRRALMNLVMAEVIEGKGRFLDQIVNGVWATCEETSWVIPAHIHLQKAGVGLADVNNQVVDLFAAETGASLAWTHYLLGDQLAQVSPLIPERILSEIDRRILSPNLETDHFWWMGFPDRRVNNWNPWINTNWLTCVLLTEQDPDQRIDAIHKTMRSVENFLNHYPADGGCDEGPGYWNVAGGRLFDYLEFLRVASSGQLSYYDHDLIKAIGSYVYKAHIHERYVVNFADAGAKTTIAGEMVYRYGKRINDPTMMAFGSWAVHRRDPIKRGVGGNLSRQLFSMFELQEMYDAPASQPYLRDAWLPDIQVMGARSTAGSPEGWYVAAKGGHNNESHNHNDVGSFIVYIDGYPALIDVGVERYRRQTFSGDRYKIWTMQSAYHNLPTVNGVMQKNGRKYRAEDVRYEEQEGYVQLSQNIAGAYPEEAGIEEWNRTIRLDRTNGVSLTDDYKLERADNLSFSFMTPYPSLVEGGRVSVSGIPKDEENTVTFAIGFDEAQLAATVEEIALDDRNLQRTWGDKLYRILFTHRTNPTTDRITFNITRP